MQLNEQAVELNNILEKDNPSIYSLLSKKGKEIYFPKKGILGQSAEAKAAKLNATIGIALEDNGAPMTISAIASKVNLEPKDVFLYAPTYGKPELREKWKDTVLKRNPLIKTRISMPLVTAGITHSIFAAAYLFAEAEDKIILPDLYWGNYKLIFSNAFGAKLETYKMFSDNKLNLEDFKKKLSESGKKKIVLLNFPNNPTGYTPTDEEADEITKTLREFAEKGDKIIVLLDDAYLGLVYKKGIYQYSLFSKLADLHENILAVKIDGATKEEYSWGLRVGFMTFASKSITEQSCQALEAKAAGAIRLSVSNCSHVSQSLVLEGLNSENYDKDKQKNHDILKKRFLKVEEVLKDKKYEKHFKALPYNSGYFMCIELSKDAENVRKILLDKYSTGVIAIGNLLRIAFSSVPESRIKELFDNIFSACQES